MSLIHCIHLFFLENPVMVVSSPLPETGILKAPTQVYYGKLYTVKIIHVEYHSVLLYAFYEQDEERKCNCNNWIYFFATVYGAREI